MVSFTHHAAPDDRHSDDDLDARCRRIRQRLLDGIEETLDELALQGEPFATQQAAITHAVQAHIAPLCCPQALCRRARRCRTQPCKVPAAADRTSQ